MDNNAKNQAKRIIAFCLLIVLFAGLYPINASAAKVVSTVSSDNLTYAILEDDTAYVYYCDAAATGDIRIKSSINGYPVVGIWGNAFAHCDGIESVDIPDSIHTIMGYAFSNCTSLVEVDVPTTITTIGPAAFQHCHVLNSIDIPTGISEIDGLTFAHCYALNSVTVPGNVKSIGDSAFSYSGIRSVKLQSGVTSIESNAFQYCSRLTSISIPSTVTRIDNNAFYECASLFNIHLSDLKAWCEICIDSYGHPFYYLNRDNLTANYYLNSNQLTGELEIPDGTQTIAYCAFLYGQGITSIVVPDSVITINGRAFDGCTDVTSITFLGDAPTIGNNAFDEITAIAYYPYGNNSWTEDVRADYGGNITWVAFGEPDTQIFTINYDANGGTGAPDPITKEQDKATTISTIIPIKEGYQFLGWSTSSAGDVEYLPGAVYSENADVTLYAVWKIHEHVWDEGILTTPATHTTFGEMTYTCQDCSVIKVEQIAKTTDHTYGSWTNLDDTTHQRTCICGAIETGPHSFSDWTVESDATCTQDGEISRRCLLCDAVETKTIYATGHTYESVVTEPTCTEEGFTTYTCTTCGSSYSGNPTAVLGHSFTNYVSNGDATYEADGTKTAQCDRCDATETITDTGSKLQVAASGVCGDDLTWILTEDGILTIQGTGPMFDFLEAPWYDYRASIKSVMIDEGPTSIGYQAFSDCSLLTNVVIANTVQNIGENAFYCCERLVAVVIPDSVKEIGNYAFAGCVNLSSIEIGNRLSEISAYTFLCCNSLTHITIPDCVTIIGYKAFSDCESLVNIEIGNGVTTIEDYAFADCTKLKNVELGNGITTIGEAFYHCYDLTNIYITDISTWCNISYEYSGQHPLYYADNLYLNDSLITDLVIPEGITSISQYAFYNCKSLTSVSIPNSVQNINEYAFYCCVNLESAKIGSGVRNISEYAFYYCDSLASVDISDMTAWCDISFGLVFANPLHNGGDLYLNGTLVTNLILPDDVTSINEDVFNNCDSLLSVIISPNVTSIGNDAFYSCDNLTSVTIPNSVLSIGDNAFDGCSSLKGIYYEGDAPQIGPNAFSAVTATAYYPADNATWTSEAMQDYGGRITWTAVPSVELSFAGASLALQHNLAINYKVDVALFETYGYSTPYAEFEINGEKKTVDTYTIEGDRYVFTFCDIAPNQMNDIIYATLYATYDGVEYSSEPREYSVANYCYNMLEKCSADEYAEFRTLLVDLLHYGAASQTYTDYKTAALVDAQLTDTQLTWGTSTDRTFETLLAPTYQQIETPFVSWKGAGLNLQDAVTMRLKFTAENIDGVVLVIESDVGSWRISSEEFVQTDGGYYAFFNGLNAGQMSEPVYMTFYQGDTPVSNTARYSIESYAFSNQNSENTALAELLKAMMRYGDSAYAYVN